MAQPAKRWRIVLSVLASAALVAILSWRGRHHEDAGGKQLVATERFDRASFPLTDPATDPERDVQTARGAIAGVVLASEGAALDGATVVLTRVRLRDQQFLSDFGRALQVATTKEGGRFRFDGVGKGSYSVSAMIDGRLPAARGPIDVDARETKVELRLEKGGVGLTGEVSDMSGGPVPHARVVALDEQPAASGSPHFQRVYQANADQRGAYKLTLAPGTYRVTAEASGYVTATETVALVGPATRDLRLIPGGMIAGRVIERSSRAPVLDAQLWILTGPMGMSGKPRELRSDDAGAFSIDALEPKTYRVAARKGRLVGASLPITLGLAQTVTDVVVETQPGFAIAGRIVDATGAPIARARIQVFRDRPPFEPPIIGQSDPTGRFRYEGLSSGAYRLEAAAEGTLSARQMLDVNRDLSDLELRLPKGASVTGRVVSTAGIPVVGATVNLRVVAANPAMIGLSDRKATDASGRYSFRGLASGALTVTASDEAAGLGKAEPATLGEGEAKVIDLVLSEAGSIAGTVRTEDGRPAAGVRVQAQPQGGNYQGRSARATTAVDGTYRLAPLEAGDIVVKAVTGDTVWFTKPEPPDQKSLTLGEREQRRGVDLVVGAGRKISGVVVDGQRVPVSGADVRAFQEPAPLEVGRSFSRPDGTFVIENVGSGKHTMRAGQVGFADAEVTGIVGGATQVEIALIPESTVSGVVVATDGQPVVDYTVALVAKAKPGEKAGPDRFRYFGSLGDTPTDLVRDPAGRFSLGRLRGGAYDVVVRTTSGGTGSQSITLAAGEKKAGVRVVLNRGGRLVGRVVDFEDGGPLPNVDVAAMADGVPGRPASARTDPAGKFALEAVPAGESLRVYFSPADKHVSERRRIEVGPSGTLDLGTIKLLRGDVAARQKEGTWNGHPGFDLSDDGTFTIRVRPDSPPAKAGVLSGDLLVAIDGREVRDLGNGGSGFLLQGRPGSAVALIVKTPGGPPRTVTVPRIDVRSAR